MTKDGHRSKIVPARCSCFWRCNCGSWGCDSSPDRPLPANQAAVSDELPRQGGHAVSCLPLLPPNPAFHLPRTAAGVSTGLACLRGTPTAPPDHSCWSQERAIETTEAHKICKPLFASQRIKYSAMSPLGSSHLQPAEPTCTVASARRPEAVAVDAHQRQRQQKFWRGWARGTRWRIFAKKGNKEGAAA